MLFLIKNSINFSTQSFTVYLEIILEPLGGFELHFGIHCSKQLRNGLEKSVMKLSCSQTVTEGHRCCCSGGQEGPSRIVAHLG